MPRIRSLKPEAFQSESLAEVSLGAERTFFGLSTIADDRGRIADKPAQINGELWSMRGQHGRDDLENELQELVKEDVVCRYVGCDGKRYLHLVKWDDHQKIDRPSKSRLPRCPFHQLQDDCGGRHEGACIARESPPDAPESSRESREDSMQAREASRESGEASMLDLGSRTVDRGSVPPSAGAKRAGKPPPSEAHIGTVVAAFVDGATEAGLDTPAAALKARVGKQARALLAEGKPIDKLLEAARHMGAGEWNDLAVQFRKDDAAAKGRTGPNERASPKSTTDRRAADAQALKAKFRPAGDDQPIPPNTIPGSVIR